MKKSYGIQISLLAILFVFIANGSVLAQKKTEWTKKRAEKWVKSREWANGLNIQLSPATDNVEFAKQYHANKAYWDKAFAFMRDHNLADMAPGKYVIDSTNVVATITEAPSKAFEKSAWESHRRFIDLQYVIKGEEKIGVSPLSESKVIKPYDERKDGANYEATGKYYIATPSEFFLFFPNDVHRPNISVPGFDTVKKLVIKIRVAN
jgi:YhcH/YjgK/YiaL family protein